MQELDAILEDGWGRVFDLGNHRREVLCYDGSWRPLYYNQEEEIQIDELLEILAEIECGSRQSAN